jgi:hypothetical protein
MLAEQRFRRLDAPEKMNPVYLGISFEEGLEAKGGGNACCRLNLFKHLLTIPRCQITAAYRTPAIDLRHALTLAVWQTRMNTTETK